jgi:hypothetical protein
MYLLESTNLGNKKTTPIFRSVSRRKKDREYFVFEVFLPRLRTFEEDTCPPLEGRQIFSRSENKQKDEEEKKEEEEGGGGEGGEKGGGGGGGEEEEEGGGGEERDEEADERGKKKSEKFSFLIQIPRR